MISYAWMLLSESHDDAYDAAEPRWDGDKETLIEALIAYNNGRLLRAEYETELRIFRAASCFSQETG